MGSVFSPYYAWARRRGRADPEQHCALNVCIYGERADRWAMTERGATSVTRGVHSFRVGPSGLEWRAGRLTVDFDEITAPWPTRVRGRVTLYPDAISRYAVALDGAGRHRWGPIAPAARVQVDLERPCGSWIGTGYFDANEGDEPVESGFERWDWWRAPLSAGRSAVVYDLREKSGAERRIALEFGTDARATALPLPARRALPPSLWRLARHVHADADRPLKVERVLEDGPFYSRAVVSGELAGQPVTGMHETLDCRRLTSPVVRMMTPVRMPRRA